MKKYWKLLMLAIFTSAVVSIHYVQAARETSDFLTLRLETIRGDESVVKDRVFYGSYTQSPIYTPATVTLDGYTTPLKGLYVYDMFSTYLPAEMEPFTEQYRSFMRGKAFEPMYYYEDDKRLVYVDVPFNSDRTTAQPIAFNISSLSKDDGTQLDYTALTLQSFPSQYVNVQEVQLVDGYIKVVARVYEEGAMNGLYVFTIDETKRIVIENKQLLTIEEGEDDTVHQMYTDYSFTPQTNFLYGSATDYLEDSPNNETVQAENANDFKLYKIDLKTMAIEPIDIPDALRKMRNNAAATNEATYFISHSDDNLELFSYHFNNNEWTHVELEDSFEIAYFQIFIVDDVLYIAYEDADKSMISAYDPATGKLLYKGAITSESNSPFYFRVTSVK